MYQCVHRKGVVLRPTAGCGDLHEVGTLVPPPAVEGAFGLAQRIAAKLAKMSVTAIEELEILPGTLPRCLWNVETVCCRSSNCAFMLAVPWCQVLQRAPN